MFNGGHQRHSYPLDKRVPKMPKKEREMNYGYSYYIGYGSGQRQVEKQMHKKKQRQYNASLIKELMN